MAFKNERRSLLSSAARVQVPWIKVTIGKYTFGVYSKQKIAKTDDDGMYYTKFNVQYPNYIQSLDITKINGQVNQYSLSISYPVTQVDDPNFFEKVFSSVSKTRKITFSYGDMSMPTYIYRDEEAIITKIKTQFDLKGGAINYTVDAVSSAALNSGGSWTFPGGTFRPSDKIKDIFNNGKYGLQSLFTGMNKSNIDSLIPADDKAVYVESKRNISAIDYITYLVSCMIPEGFTKPQHAATDIYVLTMHDDTTFDDEYRDSAVESGSYFKIERVSYKTNKSDAFQVDIGFGNTGTIVTAFSVYDDENYSLLYDYSANLDQDQYVKRLDNNGNWTDVWAPTISSKNDNFITKSSDITWWTKVTKYPIKASITIQGLLRPAILMTHLRLNVIFPGGRKHISSGLYLVTQQKDSINGSGYRTTLQLVKISGDNSPIFD